LEEEFAKVIRYPALTLKRNVYFRGDAWNFDFTADRMVLANSDSSSGILSLSERKEQFDPDFVAIVSRGARAIPFLCAHLKDPRPTALTISRLDFPRNGYPLRSASNLKRHRYE
jgi:hypothetical protein